jgi:UrcA family protein
MNRWAFVLALMFAPSILPGAVLAEPFEPGVKLVRYDDLDLSTAAGMKVLHRRIEAALDDVCLDPNGPSPGVTVNTACKAESRRHALAETGIAAARQQASRASAGAHHAIASATTRPVPAPKR